MRALRRLGRHVPDDISVVGFDGIELVDLVEPGLATLATPNRQMGERAAELVIDAIRDGARLEMRPHFLPFEFQLRGSLGVRRTGTAETRTVARSSA
jgi:DNA-binding LacI/PurR family transcriptional regulator